MHPDIQTSLPWSGDGTFELWRYLNSHSQLILRQIRSIRSDFTQIAFEGVRWMEMGRFFPDNITLTEAADVGTRPTLAAYPHRLLLTELTASDGRTGFVAAHKLRITRISVDEQELEILLAMRVLERDRPASE